MNDSEDGAPIERIPRFRSVISSEDGWSDISVVSDVAATALLCGVAPDGSEIAVTIRLSFDEHDKAQMLFDMAGVSRDEIAFTLKADCGHPRDMQIIPAPVDEHFIDLIGL